MAKEIQEERGLVDFVAGINGQEKGFTAAQIATAYRAALQDFVQRKTSRNNSAQVSDLLKGALAARKQELAEKEELTSQMVKEWY